MKKNLPLLVLISLLIFTGCSKETTDNAEPKYTYYSAQTKIENPLGMDIFDCFVTGDKIYSLGAVTVDVDECINDYYVSVSDFTGKNLSCHLMFETSDYFEMEAFLASPNGNVLFAYGKYDDNEEWINNVFVYDEEWNEISSDDTGIDGAIEGSLVYPLSNNNFLLVNGNKLTQINAYLETLNAGQLPNNAVVLPASQSEISVLYNERGTDYIAKISETDLSIHDAKECPVSFDEYGLLPGDDHYLFYVNNREKLFGYNNDELIEIMNFFDCGIESGSGYSDFKFIDENHLRAITFLPSDVETPVVYITDFEKGLDERSEITVGVCQSYSDCYLQAAAFNRENKNYRVKIVDYTDYVTDENPYGDREQIILEMTSGEGPDILEISTPDFAQLLMQKKALTPLDDFLKNDEEINTEDFFPNLIEAGSFNGKLYTYIPSFCISTMVMSEEDRGRLNGWSLNDFEEYIQSSESKASTIGNTSRDDILHLLLSANFDSFIKKDKVDLTNETFYSILEIANSFPKSTATNSYYSDDEIKKYRSKEITVLPSELGSNYSYVFYRYGVVDAPISCIGIPGEKGGENLISYRNSLSISANCKEKDGAWEFVRRFMSDDYLRVFTANFVSKKSLFNDNIRSEFWYPVKDYVITQDDLTDADADFMYELIQSAENTAFIDTNIERIIEEESAAFFDDQKSAEEVAKIIESRVSIYLKESK